MNTTDPYEKNNVDRITVASEALREEVLRPGTSVMDENNKTHEPVEKFVEFKLNKVLTGAHAPSRDKPRKHSTEDESNFDLVNDPGKNTTLTTSEVGECTPVPLPVGHRKDAGITDLSREVNSDTTNLNADSDPSDLSRKTHSKILVSLLYHTGKNVKAENLLALEGRETDGEADHSAALSNAMTEVDVDACHSATTFGVATKKGVKAHHLTAVENVATEENVKTGETFESSNKLEDRGTVATGVGVITKSGIYTELGRTTNLNEEALERMVKRPRVQHPLTPMRVCLIVQWSFV